ncbi:hypothetical protein [Candidatus Puniceispirillum sp.]|mgnify:CR=1 FL=1|jgi:hypothetical protein|uniref:hypothetical protein n=1 Tax=Candidatus Puniceispirillum sp. TaxID=2026719 RepID=UPI001ED705B9|nr:hypothetical protein [Candidatus Puniceispirillum sp.]
MQDRFDSDLDARAFDAVADHFANHELQADQEFTAETNTGNLGVQFVHYDEAENTTETVTVPLSNYFANYASSSEEFINTRMAVGGKGV